MRSSEETNAAIVSATTSMALELGVVGLCNVQFVVHQGRVHVIEINPRSSRTVPFLSKVTGVPMVELATRVMLGETLQSMGWPGGLLPPRPLVAVKAPVFSMIKLTEVDPAVGPEMKSTGEVMGIDCSLGAALQKAFLGALGHVPETGGVLCSIADPDKAEALPVCMALRDLGFTLHATGGTAAALRDAGIDCRPVGKIGHGQPNVIDLINDGLVSLVINTVSHAEVDDVPTETGIAGTLAEERERRKVRDGFRIRSAAEQRRIPCCTSLDTARALVDAIGRHASGLPLAIGTVRQFREGGVCVAPERG